MSDFLNNPSDLELALELKRVRRMTEVLRSCVPVLEHCAGWSHECELARDLLEIVKKVLKEKP